MKCKDEVIFNHRDYNSFFACNFKMGAVSPSVEFVPERLRLMFTHNLVGFKWIDSVFVKQYDDWHPEGTYTDIFFIFCDIFLYKMCFEVS